MKGQLTITGVIMWIILLIAVGTIALPIVNDVVNQILPNVSGIDALIVKLFSTFLLIAAVLSLFYYVEPIFVGQRERR